MATIGEERVLLEFTPTDSPLVHEIKAKTADLIDLCEQWLKEEDGRLAALAQTAYEQAAMWAVKAATTK